jgi:hypothetical protein
MGTSKPGLPVAGSVTLALLTSTPLWVLRALHVDAAVWSANNPEPGGRMLSTRSFRFSASRTVFSEIVCSVVVALSSVSVAVTVTSLLTAEGFSSRGGALSLCPRNALPELRQCPQEGRKMLRRRTSRTKTSHLG